MSEDQMTAKRRLLHVIRLDIENLRAAVDVLIVAEPSGPLRDEMTDLNIHLTSARCCACDLQEKV